MSDLVKRLERLGLSQYLDVFIAEGFDSWETILDITESDLLVIQSAYLERPTDAWLETSST